MITSLPASGWNLNGRNCNPDGIATANSGATAIVMRLNNSSGNQRATCTFTFTFSGGTITAHKGGLRNTATNNTDTFATGLQGATFEYSPNANFSAPVNDLCVTPSSTDVNGACVSAPDRERQLLRPGEGCTYRLEHDPADRLRRRRVRSEPTGRLQPAGRGQQFECDDAAVREPAVEPGVDRGVRAERFVGARPVGLDHTEQDDVRERGEEFRQCACVDAVADEDLQFCCDARLPTRTRSCR